MRHLVIAGAILAMLLAGPAWANFSDGQARYQGGDYKGALELWLPLAEGGDMRSQFSVAIMYERGLGTAQDLARAQEWYGRAAAQGYAPAAAALRGLQQRMPPPQQAAPAPAPRPRTQPPPRQLSEKEQIELVAHSLVQQVNLQLRVGQLEYEDIAVNEVSDGFEVAVRKLALHGEPGERLDIGDVTAHIARDGKRYYRIEFRLPDRIEAHEPGADTPAHISIGKQSNTLLWDRDLELVVDFDVRWSNLQLDAPDGTRAALVADVSMISDLASSPDGLWSGPVTLRLAEVSLNEPDRGELRLGEVSFRTLVDRLDMARYAQLSRAVSAGQGQTPEQTLGQVRGLIAGFAVEVTLADLKMRMNGGPKLELAKATYRFGLGGFDKPLATIDMGFSHAGLNGAPPEVPELAPRDARIHFVLERLPVETLLQTGLAAGLEYLLFGQVAQQGDVLNQLRLSLSNAGTQFVVSNGRFEGPKLLLTVAGALAADAQALFGLSGGIDVNVQGIDNLIAALPPAGAPRPTNAGPPPLADLLRSLGQPSADGKTYSYRFEINRQGQFLVNGQDATPLMLALFSG
jgi:hypothetical protein